MSDASAQSDKGNGTSSELKAVIVALRRIGPASPDAVVAELGISRGAALARLRALERLGFVVRDVERHGVGRPRHRYDLTGAAQAQLPSNYASLATGLLDALQAVTDVSLVSAVFAERRRRQAELIRERFTERGIEAAPLGDRVRELAVIQDEQGYLCDCTASEAAGLDPEAFRMRQANCAIFDVARDHSDACAAELDLYREVLGAEVIRVAHIASGDRTCTYRIEPFGPGGSA